MRGSKPTKKKTTLADAPVEPPAPARHERKFLHVPEWRRLLEAARASGLREEALVLVMYEAGMRREEPGLLRLSYAQYIHNKQTLFVWRGKGSRNGDVHLSKVACAALMAWINEVYPHARLRQKDWFIFPGRQYDSNRMQRGITGRQVYNIIRELAVVAKLSEKVAHPHILKHSRVQHILDAGFKADVSIEKLYQSIAAIVGHAAARTTIEHYSAATGAEKQLVDRVTDELVR